jgi:hypothetical protein
MASKHPGKAALAHLSEGLAIRHVREAGAGIFGNESFTSRVYGGSWSWQMIADPSYTLMFSYDTSNGTYSVWAFVEEDQQIGWTRRTSHHQPIEGRIGPFGNEITNSWQILSDLDELAGALLQHFEETHPGADPELPVSPIHPPARRPIQSRPEETPPPRHRASPSGRADLAPPPQQVVTSSTDKESGSAGFFLVLLALFGVIASRGR